MDLMMLFDDLISLFYPRLCAGCNTPLVKGEEVLCLNCLADLPRTNYHLYLENPVFQIFIGRAKIELATSFCHFDKGGRLQHLLHQLKYKGNCRVGQKLGMLLGADLIQNNLYQDIDAIIPVPLHPKKEKKRGFNQSAEIGKGLSESMCRPLIEGNLVRAINVASQTRKGRFERWENVSGIFRIKNGVGLTGKHLLLVDDVVTTGATLEACCEPLLAIPGVRVSIATLACA
jgi:ComF family protein